MTERSEFESLLHVVQIGSGVHLIPYTMSIGGSFPGVKRQGSEADHLPRTRTEVKKMWTYPSTPPYVFMAWCIGTTLLYLRSNVGRETSCPDRNVSCFPRSFQKNTESVPSLDHDHFFPDVFQFITHEPSYHPTLYV
jgi:hypothetical protein